MIFLFGFRGEWGNWELWELMRAMGVLCGPEKREVPESPDGQEIPETSDVLEAEVELEVYEVVVAVSGALVDACILKVHLQVL